MADDHDAAAEDQRPTAEAAAHRAKDARRAEEGRLRAAALDAYEHAHEALWAQATAVVNVKALIPVLLDQATNTYTKWRGMFLTVLGKYALTRHVLEDEAFPSRPAWVQANCCVLTWIYSTVSGDLQQSLMMRQGPARGAWCYLEDEFLGQRESRALLLETKFRNFRQESLRITDYCRQLESMAASLAEFGDPIDDRQMVLTLLRGLGGKFRQMVSILKMHRPFPTFAEARAHLLLELEIDARPPSPPSALVAATLRDAAPGAPAPPRPGAHPPACPSVPNGQRNGRRRGRGGRNGHHQGQPTPPGARQGGAPRHASVLRASLGWHCTVVAIRSVRAPTTAASIQRSTTIQRLWQFLRRSIPSVRYALRGNWSPWFPGARTGVPSGALEPHSRRSMASGRPCTLSTP
jgi:hypothetical protein